MIITQNSNFWQKLKKPILCLAPIAGITDSAFSQICKKYGADVLYTEMTSADGLFYDSKKTFEFLKLTKKEYPVVLQLFGKDPEKFKKATKIVSEYGFDGIDINFGCPAKKVVAHKGGVTLMKDLDKCYEIIKAVCDSTSIPVSVKIRAGINDKDKKITAMDFVKKIKDLPVSAIMIHGRTYEQKFSGTIDYEIIKQVKLFYEDYYKKCCIKKNNKDTNLFKRPIIIANGGIMTPEDAKKTLEKTEADGVGIARGVYGKPFIFSQIKSFLKTGKYNKIDIKLIKKCALVHAKILFKAKPNKAHFEFRKHLLWYTKGIPNISKLRDEIVRVENVSDVKRILAKI